jgi:cell pole-organizing protein PopZ
MSDKKLSAEPSMDEILASIRRILAEDDATATHPAVRLRGNSDVLDLTEAVNDDGSMRHITPVAPVMPETPSPKLPDGRVDPAAPMPGQPMPGQPMPGQPMIEPRLVSEAASDAVVASFARLASVSTREDGEHSLDDLVRETLRPMLQAWLDENLPALVERLVRAEIARVVGAIRPAAP